jgi:peptide methionine sulfoxide reductase MsrB
MRNSKVHKCKVHYNTFTRDVNVKNVSQCEGLRYCLNTVTVNFIVQRTLLGDQACKTGIMNGNEASERG